MQIYCTLFGRLHEWDFGKWQVEVAIRMDFGGQQLKTITNYLQWA